MAADPILLPGDYLDPKVLPSHPSKALKLGPGLLHIPPNSIVSTVAGRLCTDNKKNAVWVEYNSGRYIPVVDDLVIATIHHSATDFYYASISDYSSNAILPNLSFEGASRKSRPQLAPGALVYARITLANKHMDLELECVSASTGKSDGLGPLTGGMVFSVSLAMARRLMLPKPGEQGQLVLLEELGAAGASFEIAVGRNGRVWVDSKSVKSTLAIGNMIQRTDQEGWMVEKQRIMAKRMAKEIS
ncbi:hypothetical protein BJ878DRAFT_63713 [Calycina marina]|uniref:Ribosomal RNA-processing protein 40 n=1 Tax=Calycina marina TaxID=1763456 RepID=A0A9P7Z3A3_9HELO|nr:hypothetical protein BJ878DRAFT_63713 [Calycina marina]